MGRFSFASCHEPRPPVAASRFAGRHSALPACRLGPVPCASARQLRLRRRLRLRRAGPAGRRDPGRHDADGAAAGRRLHAGGTGAADGLLQRGARGEGGRHAALRGPAGRLSPGAARTVGDRAGVHVPVHGLDHRRRHHLQLHDRTHAGDAAGPAGPRPSPGVRVLRFAHGRGAGLRHLCRVGVFRAATVRPPRQPDRRGESPACAPCSGTSWWPSPGPWCWPWR
ncbi:MAG: hypothetical protein MZW92_05550 [Comamonadaceae bacterium]|nr:hypothetical protein [Comamonadaceae bacterium]